MDLQKAKAMLESADVIHDEGAVQKAVGEVAAAISARLADKYPLVLCVMTGGVVFCGQLMTRLNFPLDFDYLHATRYGDALSGHGAIEWRVPPDAGCAGRSVLVIDDILDEGHTLAAICAELRVLGAAEVLTAVLVHKMHERKATPGMRADFTGLEIADRFLFGCGMDYRGYWRNAAGIHALSAART